LAPHPTSNAPGLVQNPHTRPVANTSALPGGTPIVGAQVAGLSALALAFVLAVTRLSIRRPGAKPDSAANPETGANPAAGAAHDPGGDNPDRREAPPENPPKGDK